MSTRLTLIFAGLCLIAFVFAIGCGDDTSPDDYDELDRSPLASIPTADPERANESLEEVDSDPLGSHVSDRYPPSLARVIETRFLRVLTSRNSFDFFIHAGHVGGFQYDMVKRFAHFLNERHTPRRTDLPIRFELIPVNDDELIPMLLAGAGDMIAARLTITPERARRVLFSVPYQHVDEVVVTHDRTGSHVQIDDLAGKHIFVRPSSSYHESLAALNLRFESESREPVHIRPVDEALETERVLELVAARHFDYSVADSLIAEIAVQVHPNLRILKDLAVRQNGLLAWATMPEAPALVEEMNAFLTSHDRGSLLGNLAVQKHFEADRQLMAPAEDRR